jgi:hypothetical protein
LAVVNIEGSPAGIASKIIIWTVAECLTNKDKHPKWFDPARFRGRGESEYRPVRGAIGSSVELILMVMNSPLTVYLLNGPNIGITDTADTVCDSTDYLCKEGSRWSHIRRQQEQCETAFVFDLPDIITDELPKPTLANVKLVKSAL